MTERLHFHFSLSCIGGGNGNPVQCSCLENPRDRGAWWAAVYGVTHSQTRLKQLSSSSSSGKSPKQDCFPKPGLRHWTPRASGAGRSLRLMALFSAESWPVSSLVTLCSVELGFSTCEVKWVKLGQWLFNRGQSWPV